MARKGNKTGVGIWAGAALVAAGYASGIYFWTVIDIDVTQIARLLVAAFLVLALIASGLVVAELSMRRQERQELPKWPTVDYERLE